MGAFLESYVEQSRRALIAVGCLFDTSHTQLNLIFQVTDLNEQVVDISRKIESVVTKSAMRKGTALGQVDIAIVADADSAIELKLTYSPSQNFLSSKPSDPSH